MVSEESRMVPTSNPRNQREKTAEDEELPGHLLARTRMPEQRTRVRANEPERRSSLLRQPLRGARVRYVGEEGGRDMKNIRNGRCRARRCNVQNWNATPWAPTIRRKIRSDGNLEVTKVIHFLS